MKTKPSVSTSETLNLSPINFNLFRIKFNYKEPRSFGARGYQSATQEKEATAKAKVFTKNKDFRHTILYDEFNIIAV